MSSKKIRAPGDENHRGRTKLVPPGTSNDRRV